MSAIVDTDILIIGAGPSGAALASFLGQNGKSYSFSWWTVQQANGQIIGMSGLVISKGSHTADTPRAHGFSPFALGKIGYRYKHEQLLTGPRI
jgi:flavin-dependent dehydrogenase